MGKEAFNRKWNLFYSSKDLVKYYSCNVLLFGCETWPLRKTDEDRIKPFEVWMRRKMKRINWIDRVSNEKVLNKINENRTLLNITVKRK